MDTVRWILDSYSTEHMCSSIDVLTDSVSSICDMTMNHIWYGTLTSTVMAQGYLKSSKEPDSMFLEKIMIIPDIKVNIISISKLMQSGYGLEFFQNRCVITKNGLQPIVCYACDNAYELFTEKSSIDTNDVEDKITCVNITDEPENWKDILHRPEDEKELWYKAMNEEISIMNKNNVWTVQEPPPDIKPIGCRWTFSIKKNHLGKIIKLRARLVAKGCGQIYGQNYDETYAPVVKHESIRALLTVAGKEKMNTIHCDINAAFLYGELTDLIYMKGPCGPWDDLNKLTFRLNKSIYGLKQAARIWNIKIDNSLKNCNFEKSLADPCLYHNNGAFALIHVDDILLVGPNHNKLNMTIESLKAEYEIKVLGPVKCYLGIFTDWDEENSCFYIHQRPKIEKLLMQNKMTECFPKDIPMEPGYLKGIAHSTSPKLENNIAFQQVVGSLMYLGLVSRPDIHLASNLLGRRTAHPSEYDWNSIKRILKYLKGTINIKLKLGGFPPLLLRSYCDADWGGDTESRKSTSGQLHFIGDSAISWRTKKQTCISLSTAEAEYVAAAQCAQEVIWIQRLLQDLNITQQLPTTIHTDNLSCMDMTVSQKLSNRTKHIDLKYMFLRDLVLKNVVKLIHIPTEEQTADMFTKPLPRDTLRYHISKIGILYNKECDKLNTSTPDHRLSHSDG